MRWGHWHPPALLRWPHTAVLPLVNVLLVLVGFAGLSPIFLTPTGISVQLPQAVTAEAVGGAGVVITISSPRLLYLNGQLLTVQELPPRLTVLLTEDPRRAVLIEADRQVEMGQVAAVWDVCRHVGVTRISMATTKAPE